MADPAPGMPEHPDTVLEDMEQIATVERRTLGDEQEAFDQFASRLESIAPASANGRPRLPVRQAATSGLKRVCDAYRATVMAVPHYRDEYDESLPVHLGEELGENLALALTQGSSLSPPLKASLAQAAALAVERRSAVIDTLDREIHALDRHRERLGDVHSRLAAHHDRSFEDARFDTLQAHREELLALRARCEGLVAERQEQLRELTRTTPGDLGDFGAYLYGGDGAAHPMIAYLTDVLEVIEHTMSRIENRLAIAP